MSQKDAISNYIESSISQIFDVINKFGIAVWDNPTNIGKSQVVQSLISQFGKTLIVSQSYDINRQWNLNSDVVKNSVFTTYSMLSSIDYGELVDFCSPYNLIIFDEAHHTGAQGYITNVSGIIDNDKISAKIFGVTTHTKRYSDSAEDVANTVFCGHKIEGISFESAITEGLLPQFDYVSALYSLPKDIEDIIAGSSLAKRIISDSRLAQVNDEEIRNIINKHIPDGKRKVIYFVPTIEDSEDAEKLSRELGYGNTYVINYSKSDAENRKALEEYNTSESASIVCISKFNEGELPKGTNTVVILRKTMTVSIFERQVLAAISSATEKPIIYDFVSNIDNLVYSSKTHDNNDVNRYIEHISSLCNQSIIVDYARPWVSVFNKIRKLAQNWTEAQDEILTKLFPKYGEDVYKYIPSHSKKECLYRAEVLGLKYVPLNEEITIPREKGPFSFSPKTVFLEMEGEYGFTAEFLHIFAKSYKKTLKKGFLNANIYNEIKNFIFSQHPGNPSIKEGIKKLSESFIESTVINNPEKEEEIKNSERIFKERTYAFASSLFRKPSTNIVIVDGKAFDKKDAIEALKAQKAEKDLEDKILVGDTYMSSKSTIAGELGRTEAEHALFKAYLRMATNRYKKSSIPTLINNLANYYSYIEAAEKLKILRAGRKSWEEYEINLIISEKNKVETYAGLIKKHSDLDILDKAKELNAQGFVTYAEQQTRTIDKHYQAFIQDFKEIYEQKENKRLQAELQKKQEEENRIKNIERKKQLKQTKAKIIVVSKNNKNIF